MASRANQMKDRALDEEGLEFEPPLYPSVNQAIGFFSNSAAMLVPRICLAARRQRNRRLS